MMLPPEVSRSSLIGLAYRMLGTLAEAEDAVQEAYERWLRLDLAARNDVLNPVGWFATVTSRICLDVLKSARRRRELYVGPWLPEPIPDARFSVLNPVAEATPEDAALVRDSVGAALMVVMELMTPAERVAFVLKDIFGYSIADIAEVLQRSEGATRQLASSARARVKKSRTDQSPAPRQRHALTEAFAQAAASGDVAALLKVLNPAVVLKSDGGGVVRAALNPILGQDKVARFLLGVLERQAPVELRLHESAHQSVLTTVKDGRVTGVLVVQGGPAGITDVWIQWNPHKLSAWQV